MEHKSLSEYTLPELRNIARKQKVRGFSTVNKQQLIELIKQQISLKQQNCPEGKICNPLSGKYVKKEGKIGKKVISPIYDFKNHGWFIFTKSSCGYCKKAKDLFIQNNIKFKETEITPSNQEEIYKITDELTSGYRYFPMIFKDGVFFGGYTELITIM